MKALQIYRDKDVVEKCFDDLSETQKLSEQIREAVKERIAASNIVEPVKIGRTKVASISSQFDRSAPIAKPKQQSSETSTRSSSSGDGEQSVRGGSIFDENGDGD